MLPVVRAVLAAVIGLLLTLVGLVTVQLNRTKLPSWPVLIAPDQMELRLGQGRVNSDGLMIERAGQNETSVVLVQLPAIEAEGFGTLSWHLKGLTSDQDLQIFWVSSMAPLQLQAHVLTDSQKQEGVVNLTTEATWAGRIELLGLTVQGEISQPLTLAQVLLMQKPRTIAYSLRVLLRSWTYREPWSMRSINFREHVGNQWQTIPLIQATIWLLISGSLFMALSIKADSRSLLTGSAALLMVAWLVLDAQWQWQLYKRLQETFERHSDTLPGARNPINDTDGSIAKLVTEVRKYLSPNLNRIIMVTADPDGFLSLRTRYRLLPLNTNPGMMHLPDPDQVQADDYLLLIQPPADIQYNPATRQLVNGVRRLPVEPLMAIPGIAVLYRMRVE
ncbi:hypothetical protein F2Q65_01125 [Thiohalocapsa marina]|uniref:Uncharacterized protein n=1 Tax=Thiohalocapsa marina TaxID=424902 RepID=A0A5M8FVX6_9GAMM|nr:hypothetical protein [Thiohalocapsa marina]KAA6187869.1 hypothetical protein F2Q65_01125 [Thiohalocapsa marina]